MGLLYVERKFMNLTQDEKALTKKILTYYVMHHVSFKSNIRKEIEDIIDKIAKDDVATDE